MRSAPAAPAQQQASASTQAGSRTLHHECVAAGAWRSRTAAPTGRSAPASPWSALRRYSRCRGIRGAHRRPGSTTRVAERDVLGLTTPEKRMNSEPWLMPICFSPRTSRLPLGSTSITVTVMVPVNTLLLARRPCRRTSFAELAARSAAEPWSALPGRPAQSGTDKAVCCPCARRADVEVLLRRCFSLMMMVSVSPTARARRSSNSGR